MPEARVMYTLDGRPVTEEPEGTPEERHYKRIINQVSGYVREICTQMTATVPKAIVTCMVLPSKERLLEALQVRARPKWCRARCRCWVYCMDPGARSQGCTPRQRAAPWGPLRGRMGSFTGGRAADYANSERSG